MVLDSPNWWCYYLFNEYIEVFFRFHLMCEHKPIVLSAIIIFLTVTVLLLSYLLTEKICLWETDQANSSSLPDNKFLRFLRATVKRCETPFSVERKFYRVWHIFCRRSPTSPKMNLPLIDFGVISFLWNSAHSTSLEQWYYGLIELEVKFLKFLRRHYLNAF